MLLHEQGGARHELAQRGKAGQGHGLPVSRRGWCGAGGAGDTSRRTGGRVLIFISHSCKDKLVKAQPAGIDADQLARLRFALELRDTLDQQLGAITPVWFDRARLQPGDEWEAAIVTALHECQGAVLLLTPDALKSPWVLREATVLADRRGRSADLRLVTVLCAGVDHKTLAADPHWAALSLTRWQPVQALRGAYRGKAATTDRNQIVAEVQARMQGLAQPQDERHGGWTQALLAFLGQLARDDHTERLNGAARALGLKAPLAWDGDALRQLARMLLQSGAAEPDANGQPRYPLLQALAALIPGDPKTVPRSVAEKTFFGQLKPLAAPPEVSVAVGAAGRGAEGQADPVLVRAGNRRVAELAAYRASCSFGWVRSLSGVGGEQGPSAATLQGVNEDVEDALSAGQDCFVVAELQPLAGEDPLALAQKLGRQLPAGTRLVGTLDRAAAASAPVVDVPEPDEQAALRMDRVIDKLRGPL